MGTVHSAYGQCVLACIVHGTPSLWFGNLLTKKMVSVFHDLVIQRLDLIEVAKKLQTTDPNLKVCQPSAGKK